MRVIGADGGQVGVLTRFEALDLARSSELDLVEVSPQADPPVVRVMDFGKFLFEQNKKSHAAKRKQKQIQIKEIKFRPGTDENDYQIKLRNIIRFLTEGDKAKVTLRFRGREMAHTEIGRKLLDRLVHDLARTRGDRAEPADGRPADGHDVRAEKEVTRQALQEGFADSPVASRTRKRACLVIGATNGSRDPGVDVMPKLKTNRAAAKRFRKTAKGWKSYSAGRRHNLGHKPRKTKRQLRSGGSSLVHKSDMGRIDQLMPNTK